MSRHFRLVPKFNENCLFILYEMNGDVRIIAQVLLLADRQTAHDVEMANDICKTLRKRIRQSL